MRDVRTHVRGLERGVPGQLALDRRVPLLHVAGAQPCVNRKDTLPQPRGRRWRDRSDAYAVRQHECRSNRIERTLRHGLQERKGRRGERGRDARHLDPHHGVPRADNRPVGESVDGAETRAEVVLLQRTDRVVAWILQLLRLEIEHGRLTADFRGREVQRIAQPRVERQPLGHFPIVLDEVLLKVGPLLYSGVLQVDREVLDLPQEEARERRPGAGHAGQIAADGVEGEGTCRRRRLDDVQSLPAPVEPHLQRVAAFHPGERVGDLGHARAEVGCRVGWRPELLVAADQERGHRVRKLGRGGNTGNPERGSGRRPERRGITPNRASRVAKPEFVEHVRREGPLVVRRKRPRVRVLRPERARRDAAAVGKRRHRGEAVPEVRQATKHLVAIRGELVVDPRVPLILAVHLVGCPPIVVRGARRGRQRIVVEEAARDRVHLGNRDSVFGKSLPAGSDRRRRVVDDRYAPGDGLGEDPLALQQRRDRGNGRAGDTLSLPLVVHEEERAVTHERAAQRTTELIAPVVGFVGDGGLEEVSCVERLVSEELEHVSVQGVGAGLGRQIDHPTVEAPELRRRTVGLHLEFLDGVDHRQEGDLSRFRLQNRNPVEQIFVGAGAPAVHARELRVGRQRDAGRERGEGDERPAVQRQLHDLWVLDDHSQARGLRAQDRGIGGHRNLLADVSDLEREVDAGLLAGPQSNAMLPHRFEPGQLDVDAVRAGEEARHRIHPLFIGHHDPLAVCSHVGDGHGGARDVGPTRVLDDARHLARRHLSQSARRTHTQASRHQDE